MKKALSIFSFKVGVHYSANIDRAVYVAFGSTIAEAWQFCHVNALVVAMACVRGQRKVIFDSKFPFGAHLIILAGDVSLFVWVFTLCELSG